MSNQQTSQTNLAANLAEVWIFEWDEGCLAREWVFRTGECQSQELTECDIEVINGLEPGRIHFASPRVRRSFMRRAHGTPFGFLKIVQE